MGVHGIIHRPLVDIQNIRAVLKGYGNDFQIIKELVQNAEDAGANLAVQEGQQAGLEYLRMIDPLTSPGEKERIKEALLTYCGHDTLVMVKIREELLKRFQ